MIHISVSYRGVVGNKWVSVWPYDVIYFIFVITVPTKSLRDRDGSKRRQQIVPA